MTVTLHEITDANRDEVLTMAVTPGQKKFVGSVAGALRDAEEMPEAKPWYRAVYDGESPVGFVMLSWNVEPDPPRIIGPWFLWKLLIDHGQQGRGYGTATVRLVVDIVRAEGASQLLTSYVPAPGNPGSFYERLGFRPTGDLDENGEIILSLDLA